MSDYCKGYHDNLNTTQENNRFKILELLESKDRIQVQAFQTHTNNVVDIKADTSEYLYREVDGFITKRKDVALFTFYADCLPIFAYDMRNEVIGVWHSGWQGSYTEIMKSGIDLMKNNYNTNYENLLIALGIGISTNNYEVGIEFYNHFVDKFGKNDEIIENHLLNQSMVNISLIIPSLIEY